MQKGTKLNTQKKTEEWYELFDYDIESKLQKYAIKRLNAIDGIIVIKISDRYRSGIPDLLICAFGYFVAIELKVRNNRPTKLQDVEIARVREEGRGVSGVARNWSEIKAIINGLVKDKNLPEIDWEKTIDK